jgi:hypothetical protein
MMPQLAPVGPRGKGYGAEMVDGEAAESPPRKMPSQMSIDGDAYVRGRPSRVACCFVPPAMAM